jgi:hypothetical protein
LVVAIVALVFLWVWIRRVPPAESTSDQPAEMAAIVHERTADEVEDGPEFLSEENPMEVPKVSDDDIFSDVFPSTDE